MVLPFGLTGGPGRGGSRRSLSLVFGRGAIGDVFHRQQLDFRLFVIRDARAGLWNNDERLRTIGYVEVAFEL